MMVADLLKAKCCSSVVILQMKTDYMGHMLHYLHYGLHCGENMPVVIIVLLLIIKFYCSL